MGFKPPVYPERPPEGRARFLIPQEVWEKEVQKRIEKSIVDKRIGDLKEKKRRQKKKLEEWEIKLEYWKTRSPEEWEAKVKEYYELGTEIRDEIKMNEKILVQIALRIGLTTGFKDLLQKMVVKQIHLSQLAQHYGMVDMLKWMHQSKNISKKTLEWFKQGIQDDYHNEMKLRSMLHNRVLFAQFAKKEFSRIIQEGSPPGKPPSSA